MFVFFFHLFPIVVRALDLKDIDQNFEHYIFPQKIAEILQPYNLTLKDLRQLYFKSDEISEKTLPKLIELLGDLGFVERTHKLVKIQFHNSAAPTYLYKMSFERNTTPSKQKLNTEIKGMM